MPNHVTKFPSKEFAEQFEEASDQVRSYFEFCHEVADRFRAAQEARSELEAAGKRRPSQLRNFRRLMTDIARESEVSYSFACTAKQCGLAFDAELLATILDACQRLEYVPSRELFIQLVSVPDEHRLDFLGLVLQNKWTTVETKRERQERFGKRSYGSKKAAPPSTLFQVQDRLRLETSRLGVIFQRLMEAQEGVSCPPEDVQFQVPQTVAREIRNCSRALTNLRRILNTNGVEGRSAA